MEYSAASAYTYAKVSGMLKKTFAGENAKPLFYVKSLSELWSVLFDAPVPSVPETSLADLIEKTALDNFILQYIGLLECFDKPDDFFMDLLRRYEVINLEVITSALSLDEKTMPETINIGKYSVLKFNEWPNLAKITEGTVFSWYNEIPSPKDRPLNSYRLDLQEIQMLWKSLNKISDNSKSVLVSFYKHAYSVLNMMWALRLKVYYNMNSQQIIKNLFYVTDCVSVKDPICTYAMEIIDKHIDSYDDWKDWRFAEYLNPYQAGEVWIIDPIWIEQKLRIASTGKASKLLHKCPLSFASLAVFYILKLQELDCIRAAAECLRLNADKKEAMYVAGISG